MPFAEEFVVPSAVEFGPFFTRRNEFGEAFSLRWGRLRFAVRWGAEANVKVVLKVHRAGGARERFIVDTEPYDIEWNRHKRVTRDFFVLPDGGELGPATCVQFSFIVHLHGASIPSQHDYACVADDRLAAAEPFSRPLDVRPAGTNTWRTHEVDAGLLQRDVDWYNRHPDAVRLVPKFTRGTPEHPFHPKRCIHDLIDKVIRTHNDQPDRPQSIKVCVDCIDDTDFVNHLLHAANCGVTVQCIVDWRKTMLSHSANYLRLKRSCVELLGVFCAQKNPLLEVDADMHLKFIVFGDDDCLHGSFNISFDRWWANWESGMAFHSQGVCRLLDNVFQSVRGGVIQRYGVDPYSPFNLLYTFGRHAMLNGGYYRPHHAILAEINRARRSLRVCLFLIGELQGEHHDSVIDALLRAHHRGVDVQIILNGHMVREGDPGRACTLEEELRRPLVPAVARLLCGGVPVALAYGQTDQSVPYCPLHSKYCVVDDAIVLDGSFNWYNTSVYSHDLLAIAADPRIAQPYLNEFRQILRLLRYPHGAGSPFSPPRGFSRHHAA